MSSVLLRKISANASYKFSDFNFSTIGLPWFHAIEEAAKLLILHISDGARMRQIFDKSRMNSRAMYVRRWVSEEEKGAGTASGWRSGMPPDRGPSAPAGLRGGLGGQP